MMRDVGAPDLVHGQRVDDLAAVARQLRGLLGRDGRQQPRRGHLSRVRREDAVHLLPDLQLDGPRADGAHGGAEVRVPAADVRQQRVRHDAEEARHHGDAAAAAAAAAARPYPLGDLGRDEVVEPRAEAAQRRLLIQDAAAEDGLDDVVEDHGFGVDVSAAEEGRDDAARQLLAQGEDAVPGAGRQLPDDLGGEQEAAEALALAGDDGPGGVQDVAAEVAPRAVGVDQVPLEQPDVRVPHGVDAPVQLRLGREAGLGVGDARQQEARGAAGLCGAGERRAHDDQVVVAQVGRYDFAADRVEELGQARTAVLLHKPRPVVRVPDGFHDGQWNGRGGLRVSSIPPYGDDSVSKTRISWNGR
ncbi:hypothetical protein CTA1_1313 [Colletotrichum tanaceti]|uniref:Uncharacterized protein n=1 Tax=Colletotrichum tanaceti TaxID=1306861 RepID=A0A4U6X7Q9_9PEZI|nr:hypothetical protein CTA1_1313 [Colletotrichum tanaceti]